MSASHEQLQSILTSLTKYALSRLQKAREGTIEIRASELDVYRLLLKDSHIQAAPAVTQATIKLEQAIDTILPFPIKN